ncbi:hypothetical protein GV51_0742 [Gardnerella vaginalis 5-1]|nr:hypothetical protein GV51_0742 [Gardnerella vaginalis 5-1]
MYRALSKSIRICAVEISSNVTTLLPAREFAIVLREKV